MANVVVKGDITGELWEKIRRLKKNCRQTMDDSIDFVIYDGEDFQFLSREALTNIDELFAVFGRMPIQFANWQTITIFENELFLSVPDGTNEVLLRALILYAPMCLLPFFKPSGPFVVVHMASTLDGRVATCTGDSKWIGNQANLIHAHRIRALVDGVVVGGNTARLDYPALSVRHVDGDNPVRIVLSDTFDEVEMLPVSDGAETLFIRYTEGRDLPVVGSDFKSLHLEARNGEIDIAELVAALGRASIKSILVEGGATTFRSFLVSGCVDWIQVHVAPIIFGSGNSLLELPAIDAVGDGIRLRNHFWFDFDGEVMVTGQP